MRVERIVSGGQTGVDRAALDVALSRGLPCGGWCPKGRFAEDGVIPACYPLIETPTPLYEERTAWNVRDSDGTLVLTWGPPVQGTAYTIGMTRLFKKPCLVIDLSRDGDVQCVSGWLRKHHVRTLNVAGPRATKSPEVYPRAVAFLNALLDLLENQT
jgi:predicted Rossmann-fold nucleotide-binding protein